MPPEGLLTPKEEERGRASVVWVEVEEMDLEVVVAAVRVQVIEAMAAVAAWDLEKAVEACLSVHGAAPPLMVEAVVAMAAAGGLAAALAAA